MPQPNPDVVRTSAPRRVLAWQAEGDESLVHAGVDQAAASLGVQADEVVAAIDSGELVRGWFVDWDARPAT